MPKYLIQVSLTSDGLKGTVAEGGTSRKAAVAQLAESVGGRLEAFYYAFGKYDLYAIVEAPDNASGVAANLAVALAGVARTNTVVLLSPEEMDEASRKSTTYRHPESA